MRISVASGLLLVQIMTKLLHQAKSEGNKKNTSDQYTTLEKKSN